MNRQSQFYNVLKGKNINISTTSSKGLHRDSESTELVPRP